MFTVIDSPGELRDARLVGHKFARQQHLQDAGIAVPPFFCIVIERPWTAVSEAVGEFPGVVADVAQLTSWAESARRAAERISLPADTQAAVLEKSASLGSAAFAVRACAVGRNGYPGEDDGADPFAGLTDSYLYVGPSDLLGTISQCAASLFSVESVLYRAHRGIDASALSVCVGVQEMLEAHRSFVAFTHHPTTGSRETVVAAVYGHGEGVVAERASIDHFFVRTSGLERCVSHKQTMLCRAPNGVLAQYTVPEELADQPVLSDSHITAITALARDAERLFGGPQDIEGVITQESSIHLVQARPAARVPRFADRSIEWTNHNLTESFPGVTTAMTFSHAREFYRMTFRDFYRKVGVSESRLRCHDHHLRSMVGLLDGRMYYRLDAWNALHGEIPGWTILRPLWERSLGLQTSDPVPRLEVDRRTMAGLLSHSPRLLWDAVRLPSQLRKFLAWWDDRYAADLSNLATEDVVAAYRRVWSEAEHRWGVTILSGYLGLAVYVAAAFLAHRWTDTEEVNIAALLPGGRPNRTLESVHSAVALAEQINRIPELRLQVLNGDARQAWFGITSGAYGSKLADDAATHLRNFGDRAMNDLKIEESTPRRRPEMLVESLRPLVESETTMQQITVQESAAARHAADELRRICPCTSKRVVLHIALRIARFLARAREDTRFCRTQLYGFSREVMSRLGAELAAAGCLDWPSDYVHLEAEELLSAFDGTSTHSDLRGVARARKAAYLRSCDRPALPPNCTTATIPVDIAALRRDAVPSRVAEGSATRLVGLASSAGVVRGPAKVVLHPDVKPSECKGRILIAGETDPGWLPLMLNASGLVVERGSMLSHTAITGRMLGIPTVVAVAGATATISDDDDIEVDGGAGVVRILHRSLQSG